MEEALRDLIAELEAESPFARGSHFFDDAPTTRMRTRVAVRREIAARLRHILGENG